MNQKGDFDDKEEEKPVLLLLK
jgi:hypothetical protein